MNGKVVISTLTGAIVGFVLGYLVWGVLLMDVMAENMTKYEGLMKEMNPPDMMSFVCFFLGNVAWAWLFSFVFSRMNGINSFAKGFNTAMIIAVTVAFGYDMGLYGMMNLFNGTYIIIDVISTGVVGGIIGGVVAVMLNRGAKAA